MTKRTIVLAALLALLLGGTMSQTAEAATVRLYIMDSPIRIWIEFDDVPVDIIEGEPVYLIERVIFDRSQNPNPYPYRFYMTDYENTHFERVIQAAEEGEVNIPPPQRPTTWEITIGITIVRP